MNSALFGLMLGLMSVHRPFFELGLFSLKPFMLGMVAVGTALLLRKLSSGMRPVHISPLALPVAALIVVSGISGLLSKDIERAFILIAALVVVVGLHLLMYELAKSSSTNVTLTVICLAGAVLGLISIATYVIGLAGLVPEWNLVFFGNPNLGEFAGAPRMIGLNTDPNFSAMNMSFYFVVSVVTMFWPGIDLKLRWTAIVSSLLTGVCVLATLSRGAILGVAIGFVFLLLVHPRDSLKRLVRHGWTWALSGGVFLFLAVLVIPEESLNFAVERMSIFSFREELEAGGRPAQWLANWDIFLDHPLIGVGLGNTMQYVNYFMYGFAIQYAHNTFLEVLVETGIIGFGAFVLVVSTIFYLGWRARHRCVNPHHRILVTALIVANVAMLTEMQFLSALYDPTVWGLWAVTVGVAMRIRQGSS